MLINEVCKECGLTKKAIEYYEKRGLIQFEYESNGYRRFTYNDLVRLKEIAMLRKLSISIADIKMIIKSEDKHKALAEYKMKKEIQMRQVRTEYECLNHLIQSGYDIEGVFTEVERKLDPNTMIKDKLLHAFPGSYGKYLYIHFGKFLDEKIDSPEKEIAYCRIIEFLDKIDTTVFSQELEQYLSEVFNVLNEIDIDRMDEATNAAINGYSDFMEKNKDSIEQYLEYRNSEEFRESSAYRIQQTLIEFQKSNGYYEVFIPNLIILSTSYRKYQEKLKMANEKFLAQYPQAKDIYK
ncbi:MerR family transcriptional regulator [Petroclostridium sp. X23]|uniref:MerR family transcriptional regulator n=1 Tax=Petroclostridium sp. X23 TaxID=3045146 RepID=UPI0024AD1344|nr:MerR family transcriptional regulator [Petroclostridium sp. X23]WHH57798.1 MerR family transcriptional regulator [Petroclostridium sp. X23]